MPATMNEVACPKCSGAMWDNRLTKKNPKQPDYKCRDKACDGVIWPPREGNGKPATVAKSAAVKAEPMELGPRIAGMDDDEDTDMELLQSNARLKAIFTLHSVCFARAELLAAEANTKYGIPPTLEGVSALTAQLFIAADRRGVAV